MKSKTLVAITAWYSSSPALKTFGALPLGWHIRNPTKETTYTNLLLLGNAWTSPEGFRGNLFPLVWFSHNKKERKDFWMVFPFWWGKNPEHLFACTFPFAWSYDRKEGRFDNWSLVPFYWRLRRLNVRKPFSLNDFDGLFPLYGKNRGPKEDQSWMFLLFPAYVHAEGGNKNAHYFLFPFGAFKTAPQQYSFRIFPLVKWQRNYSVENPSVDFALLLGFLSDFTRKKDLVRLQFLRFSLLLPPLAFYEKSPKRLHARLTALFEYKRTARAAKWNVLYFVLRRAVTEREKSFSAIAPFFISTKQTGTYERQLFTPFYYNRRDYDEHRLDQKAPCRRHLNAIFPISYYERRENGSLEWSLLDPFSFLRDEENVKRHYSGLFHLIDFKERDDGSTEFRFLWRLFHRTVKRDQRSLEVFPFVYSSSGPKRRRFSLGWRLFEYEREGNRRSLRLLFSPRISWGRKLKSNSN